MRGVGQARTPIAEVPPSRQVRTRGEGVKKAQNFADIINGCSLIGTELERNYAQFQQVKGTDLELWNFSSWVAKEWN